MIDFSFNPKIANDEFNHLKNRTFKNTNKHYFNCGGYALETFSWVLIGRDDDEFEEFDSLSEKRQYRKAMAIAKKTFMEEFPEWSIVSRYKIEHRKIDPRKYHIVAFRMGRTDFHFWKLGKNFQWYEKRGSSSQILHHSYEKVFAPYWAQFLGYGYDSQILFLIKSRE